MSLLRTGAELLQEHQGFANAHRRVFCGHNQAEGRGFPPLDPSMLEGSSPSFTTLLK